MSRCTSSNIVDAAKEIIDTMPHPDSISSEDKIFWAYAKLGELVMEHIVEMEDPSKLDKEQRITLLLFHRILKRAQKIYKEESKAKKH